MDIKLASPLAQEALRVFKKQSRISEVTGIDKRTVNRWYNRGGGPDADNAELLKRAISRETNNHKSHGGTVKVIGSCSAGALTMVSETDVEEMGFDDLWRESPWWGLTDASASVHLLRVDGNSMEPNFPDKSLVAVRERGGKDLPDGTPCVFKEGIDEFTFKILIRDKNNTPSGIPLNREHSTVTFREPDVIYVVLGLMQPKMSFSLKF